MKLLKILLPILSFVISLIVYTFTLSYTITPGDSTEMVTAAITLGVPHQPSYPLSTLIGHAFSLLPLPINTVAKVNFASAFLQALTVFVFYFVMKNFLTIFNSQFSILNDKKSSGVGILTIKHQPLTIIASAFSAAMFLAFSTVFWQYAGKFEVFPLNNLFAVILLWLAMQIAIITQKYQEPSIQVFQTSSKFQIEKLKINGKWKMPAPRSFAMQNVVGENGKYIFLILTTDYLLLLSFFSAAAFTHHQTIILIFPTLLILIWPGLKLIIQRISLTTNHQPLITKYPLLLTTFYILLVFVLGFTPYFLGLLYISGRHPLMNWGDVHNLRGVIDALLRTDYGGFFSTNITLEPVQSTVYPIDNVIYYLKQIPADFTILGLGLIVYGFYTLYRKNKRMLLWVVSGVFFSGIFFLGYANLAITDSFGQATIRRFHMLPNIFFTLVIGTAIYDLLIRMKSVQIKDSLSKLGIRLGIIYLVLSFLFPLLVNFRKADSGKLNITETYINTAYGHLPPGALVLVSGDVSDMTSDYFHYVMSPDNQVMIFTPGQFHMPWFVEQVAGRYPNVVLPLPEEDKRFTSATQIIDANYGKYPIYIDPELVPHAPKLEEKYTLYPDHLLFLVKRKGEEMNLENFRKANDEIWKNLDLQEVQRIKKNSPMFEETIVFYYARHFYNVGSVFEDVKLYEDAIKEYKKVLEIDPYFRDALAALGRVYGYRLQPPDYQTGIDYLRKYQSVLKANSPDDYELGQSAQQMIEELQGKMSKAVEDDQKMQKIDQANSSTASGTKR